MDSHEEYIRKRLARNLGNMAERIIKRESPFDRIPAHVEVVDYQYQKYLEYFDEIEISLKQAILSMLVDETKYIIQEQANVGEKSDFNSRYPQHVETSDQFMSWIRNREGLKEVISLKLEPAPPIKVSMVIKRVMKERLLDFQYDKSLKVPGFTSFSKSMLTDNKVYIIADRGTKREFIDFIIGLQWPESYFDIANFFCGAQSWYEYNSEEELIVVVNKALDLIEVILPHFIDNVRNAITEA